MVGGILFVVSIYEFSSNDNSSPEGGENNDLLFFFSASYERSKRFVRRGGTIENLNLERREDFKDFLWSFSVWEETFRWKLKRSSCVKMPRNILFLPFVFVEKLVSWRFFPPPPLSLSLFTPIRRCKYHGTEITAYCFPCSQSEMENICLDIPRTQFSLR